MNSGCLVPLLLALQNRNVFGRKGYSLPNGLGFGGSLSGAFRLFLPVSLEGCVSRRACLTFEGGPLAKTVRHAALPA